MILIYVLIFLYVHYAIMRCIDLHCAVVRDVMRFTIESLVTSIKIYCKCRIINYSLCTSVLTSPPVTQPTSPNGTSNSYFYTIKYTIESHDWLALLSPMKNEILVLINGILSYTSPRTNPRFGHKRVPISSICNGIIYFEHVGRVYRVSCNNASRSVTAEETFGEKSFEWWKKV